MNRKVKQKRQKEKEQEREEERKKPRRDITIDTIDIPDIIYPPLSNKDYIKLTLTEKC